MRLQHLLLLPGWLLLAACAHESTIQPSAGHISREPPVSTAPVIADQSTVMDSKASVSPARTATKALLPEKTYNVVVNEVPIQQLLFSLARDSGVNIDIHPGIQGNVTLNAVDQPLSVILQRLSRQVNLTYRMEDNVLIITPDQPVLRHYHVDYVNMQRDTSGYIGAAAEIATTGRTNTTGTQGASTSSAGSSLNSSRTAVSSESKNRFWETLIQNIKDILTETDKEIVITRLNGGPPASGIGDSDKPADAVLPAGTTPQAGSPGDSQKAFTEYRTLFAANVIANPGTGIVTIRATNKQHERIRGFLHQVISSARRQVLIEATIVEVRLNDSYQAGIDWSRLGNGFSFSQTLNGAALPVGNQFIAGYATGSALGELKASLRLLQQFGETKVLSSPKLMVLNNQTAVLKVVDNLVYFTIDSQATATANVGTTSNFTTTPHTVPVGVVMSVTPQINASRSVMLNVRPTISRAVDYVDDPNPSLILRNPQTGEITQTIKSQIPVIQVREMESILNVDSGDTAILGGLMQDELQRASDRVPEISRIPFLGKLFTTKNDLTRKTELVIFMRPVVISRASVDSTELSRYQSFLPDTDMHAEEHHESAD